MVEGSSSTVDPHPEAAGFDNPFRRRFQLIETPALSLERIREAVPVRDLAPRSATGGWWHCAATLQVGSLVMSGGTSAPARLQVEPRPELVVLLGYGGEQKVWQGSDSWTCRANGCLLLTGEPFTCESQISSAVGFQLEPQRLLQTALGMAGRSSRPQTWKHRIEQTHGWQVPADPGAPSVLAALRQLVGMADRLADYSLALVDRLQLDDQIYRLTAALLLPELLQERPLDRLRHRERQGRDSFDELIDYIKANLDRPLNLTELESRSHYSRRALQYAFRERLGSTASQWIRHQRLDLAQQRLQNPQPGDTVASIALSSGYRSLSLFSVDFQQRFHVKPSQLLREARASLPPDAC